MTTPYTPGFRAPVNDPEALQDEHTYLSAIPHAQRAGGAQDIAPPLTMAGAGSAAVGAGLGFGGAGTMGGPAAALSSGVGALGGPAGMIYMLMQYGMDATSARHAALKIYSNSLNQPEPGQRSVPQYTTSSEAPYIIPNRMRAAAR